MWRQPDDPGVEPSGEPLTTGFNWAGAIVAAIASGFLLGFILAL